MTEPIAKRAEPLVVGDRIPDEHLAFRFNQGPAEVVFVAREEAATLPWIFVAYRYPNGQHDSMTIRPEAVLQVFPGDPEHCVVHGHAKVFACTAHGIHPHPGSGGDPMVCLDCPQCRPPGASVD
jgi:hypothetical protein